MASAVGPPPLPHPPTLPMLPSVTSSGGHVAPGRWVGLVRSPMDAADSQVVLQVGRTSGKSADEARSYAIRLAMIPPAVSGRSLASHLTSPQLVMVPSTRGVDGGCVCGKGKWGLTETHAATIGRQHLRRYSHPSQSSSGPSPVVPEHPTMEEVAQLSQAMHQAPGSRLHMSRQATPDCR